MLLTQEQVLRDITPFISEWKKEASWWFGSQKKYDNAILGYDCEVYHLEDDSIICDDSKRDETEIWCVVYPLVIRDGDLECNSDNTILEFKIE